MFLIPESFSWKFPDYSAGLTQTSKYEKANKEIMISKGYMSKSTHVGPCIELEATYLHDLKKVLPQL